MSISKEIKMTEHVENTPVQDEQTQQQPTEASTQTPDLNINDLSAIRSIIDVASQRGTFKAAELEAVGKVYNRLTSFLESVSKKEQ
jgi:hypothetical protein